MTQDTITEAELAALIQRTAEGADAYMRGEIRRARGLVPQVDGFTLMPPYGGEVMRGVDTSDAAVEAMERIFRNGEATLDVAEAYASGDLAVLVTIERQHGEVGGLPDQDWSLRVTLVFRRDETGWLLVHRHADPLVHPIGPEQLAALTRGAPR